MCVWGGLSQPSVWEALQPHLKKYWKVLEAVKNRVATHSHSVEGENRYGIWINRLVPLARTNVPGHYWSQTGRCKGTRHQWASCHWPPGAGTCRAAHRRRRKKSQWDNNNPNLLAVKLNFRKPVKVNLHAMQMCRKQPYLKHNISCVEKSTCEDVCRDTKKTNALRFRIVGQGQNHLTCNFSVYVGFK